ncbi:MAG: class I tRNA ligase family protein, partial [Gammaproteobacteria bacterium]
HHALFWPATLHFAGYRTPDHVCVHGFLTVNGQKMSKSRGTFITARTYLKFLDPDYLRYYFAAKLNDRVEDIDLNLDDFIARVNSNLVGKYVNIASRSGGFISKHFDGSLGPTMDDSGRALIKKFQARAPNIAGLYDKRQYGEAVRVIMELADQANEYINDTRPWEAAKDTAQESLLHQLCTTNINLFRLLTLYLKPILPKLAERVEEFLEIEPLNWNDADTLLTNHRIRPYQHLSKRIDPKQVAAMVAASR